MRGCSHACRTGGFKLESTPQDKLSFYSNRGALATEARRACSKYLARPGHRTPLHCLQHLATSLSQHVSRERIRQRLGTPPLPLKSGACTRLDLNSRTLAMPHLVTSRKKHLLLAMQDSLHSRAAEERRCNLHKALSCNSYSFFRR